MYHDYLIHSLLPSTTVNPNYPISSILSYPTSSICPSPTAYPPPALLIPASVVATTHLQFHPSHFFPTRFILFPTNHLPASVTISSLPSPPNSNVPINFSSCIHLLLTNHLFILTHNIVYPFLSTDAAWPAFFQLLLLHIPASAALCFSPLTFYILTNREQNWFDFTLKILNVYCTILYKAS